VKPVSQDALSSRGNAQVRDHLELLRRTLPVYRAAFDDPRLGIVVSDMSGRVVDCNNAFIDLLGREPGEVLGHSFLDITHPDDIHIDWDLFLDLLAGRRETYQIHKRYLRADGSSLPADVTVTVIRDDTGTPVLAIGIVEASDARVIRLVEEPETH
jgi:PAS domain S-box-containing protein